MTVKELVEKTGFTVLSMTDGEREIRGAYCGDLLSWVMGRAKEDQAFVTIMTNINVLAVASLLDMSCVIVCEDAEVPEDLVNAAKDKGINLLKTRSPAFETCLTLGSLI